ncbi:MAG: hypothetical protein WDN28_04910 [Chthoniobacter sp.]
MTPSMRPSAKSFERTIGAAWGHRGDGLAPIVAGDECREIETGERGDFLTRDVGRELRRSLRAEIDDERAMTAGANEPGDEAVLQAFGIHGSEEGRWWAWGEEVRVLGGREWRGGGKRECVEGGFAQATGGGGIGNRFGQRRRRC